MKEQFFSSKKPVVGLRGIHLDLKGLPPSPQRFLEILDLIHLAKINCVLVEWEDMYPWKTYPDLRNSTAYSSATVKKFLEKAKELEIELIPLVQSFGHLENVLSKRKFKNFREIPDNVSDLCPLKEGGRQVIINMIEDILESHKDIKYFHTGGDEVWSLGSCERCSKFVEKHGKAALYLHYIEPVLEYLNSKGIRPIIWDDMLRHWDISEIKIIGKLADLMCWSYGKDPFVFIKKETIEKFLKAGCQIWVASAFKGGDGAYVDVPNLQVRCENMLAWARFAKKTKIKGIVATGWSRYNTFVSPCEGLESSLDSLVLAGKIAWDGKLPQDPSKWATDFLNHCEKNGIRTSHFFECKKASEEMQNLRNSAFSIARNYFQQAHLSGEPERINQYRTKEMKKVISETLKKLRSAGKKWAKAHKGLIHNFWIKRYIISRVYPAEKILRLCTRDK